MIMLHGARHVSLSLLVWDIIVAQLGQERPGGERRLHDKLVLPRLSTTEPSKHAG
jgi:hypothetical protein